MKNPFAPILPETKTVPVPPETKVVAGGVVGYAVSLAFQLAATYIPHFTAPPPTSVALIVTTLSAVAAYWAPHTPRPGDTPPAAPEPPKAPPAG